MYGLARYAASLVVAAAAIGVGVVVFAATGGADDNDSAVDNDQTTVTRPVPSGFNPFANNRPSLETCDKFARDVGGHMTLNEAGSRTVCVVRYGPEAAPKIEIVTEQGVKGVEHDECSYANVGAGFHMSFVPENGVVVGYGVGPATDGHVDELAAEWRYEIIETPIGDSRSVFVVLMPSDDGLPDGEFVQALHRYLVENFAAVSHEDIARACG